MLLPSPDSRLYQTIIRRQRLLIAFLVILHSHIRQVVLSHLYSLYLYAVSLMTVKKKRLRHKRPRQYRQSKRLLRFRRWTQRGVVLYRNPGKRVYKVMPLLANGVRGGVSPNCGR
jgi:hypothetical protein